MEAGSNPQIRGGHFSCDKSTSREGGSKRLESALYISTRSQSRTHCQSNTSEDTITVVNLQIGVWSAQYLLATQFCPTWREYSVAIANGIHRHRLGLGAEGRSFWEISPRRVLQASPPQRESLQSKPRWLPKQVLAVNEPSKSRLPSKRGEKTDQTKKRSVPQSRTSIQSISWSRKPSFPDPFIARRQAILTQELTQSNQGNDSGRSSVSDSQVAKPRRTASLSEVAVDRFAPQSETMDEKISSAGVRASTLRQ